MCVLLCLTESPPACPPARLPACRHPRSRRACLSAWRGVQVRMLDESLEREGMRLDDAALRSDELVAIVRRYGVPPLHNICNMCVCVRVRVRVCARVCPDTGAIACGLPMCRVLLCRVVRTPTVTLTTTRSHRVVAAPGVLQVSGARMRA
jgi:hypothetical protein